MKNLVLITSVIDTPKNSLSYSKIRSVFSKKERFEQTKKTITSIKEKIPECQIMIVECSNLNQDEEELYFKENCKYFLNLWKNKDLHPDIFGKSKSLGEGTMTIQALEFISSNNIQFEYLYKISGRYWLNENFNYKNFNLNGVIFSQDQFLTPSTTLYKLDYLTTKKLLNFLIINKEEMIKCIGYENLFKKFLLEITDKIFIKKLGISGYVTVNGAYFEF